MTTSPIRISTDTIVRTILLLFVAYLLFKGPIPDGLEIDHTCHNESQCLGGWNCFHRRCVNPTHLKIVTHIENVHNGKFKGCVAKSHCSKGHPYEGSNLYIGPDGFQRCLTCRRETRQNWEKQHPEYYKNYYQKTKF